MELHRFSERKPKHGESIILCAVKPYLSILNGKIELSIILGHVNYPNMDCKEKCKEEYFQVLDSKKNNLENYIDLNPFYILFEDIIEECEKQMSGKIK